MKWASHLHCLIGCFKLLNIVPIAPIQTRSLKRTTTCADTTTLSGRNVPMVLIIIMFLVLATLPASAQIQYFGYVVVRDHTQAFGETRGITDCAHLTSG